MRRRGPTPLLRDDAHHEVAGRVGGAVDDDEIGGARSGVEADARLVAVGVVVAGDLGRLVAAIRGAPGGEASHVHERVVRRAEQADAVASRGRCDPVEREIAAAAVASARGRVLADAAGGGARGDRVADVGFEVAVGAGGECGGGPRA